MGPEEPHHCRALSLCTYPSSRYPPITHLRVTILRYQLLGKITNNRLHPRYLVHGTPPILKKCSAAAKGKTMLDSLL